MNFNPKAFSSSLERRYSNWEGTVLCLTYDLIKNIENRIDLESIQTVFDIGSRDACQSLELSDWFPNSKIYCFEPVQENADWCRKNIQDKKNILFFQKAIGLTNGIVKFHKVINGNIGASSLYKANSNHYYGRSYIQQEISVECVRGDTFLRQESVKTADLLWMDVQGAEIEVLQSFGDDLCNTKIIHTEVGLDRIYEKSSVKTELIELMNQKGFETSKCLTNSLGIEEDIIFLNKRFLK